MTLREFLDALADAGAEAARRAEAATWGTLESYCEKDENGCTVPKTVHMKAGFGEVEVPLFLLVNPPVFPLKKLELELEATLTDLDNPDDMKVASHHGLLKKGVHVKATLHFGAEAPPETIELIRERANRQLDEDLKRGTPNG